MVTAGLEGTIAFFVCVCIIIYILDQINSAYHDWRMDLASRSILPFGRVNSVKLIKIQVYVQVER